VRGLEDREHKRRRQRDAIIRIPIRSRGGQFINRMCESHPQVALPRICSKQISEITAGCEGRPAGGSFCRHEWVAVSPNNLPDIIRVGPQGVEVAVRAGQNVGVILKEAAVERACQEDGTLPFLRITALPEDVYGTAAVGAHATVLAAKPTMLFVAVESCFSFQVSPPWKKGRSTFARSSYRSLTCGRSESSVNQAE